MGTEVRNPCAPSLFPGRPLSASKEKQGPSSSQGKLPCLLSKGFISWMTLSRGKRRAPALENKLIHRKISLQASSQFFKANTESDLYEEQQNCKVSSKPAVRGGKSPNLKFNTVDILPYKSNGKSCILNLHTGLLGVPFCSWSKHVERICLLHGTSRTLWILKEQSLNYTK